MSAFIRLLCLAAIAWASSNIAWADSPAIMLNVHLESNGEISARVTPLRRDLQFRSELPAVMHCSGRADSFDDYHCTHALRRDGLSLEVVLDLAPLAQKLEANDEIQVWLDYPRLGFESASVPLKYEGGWWSVARSGKFIAGADPTQLRVQFGYHRDQLAAIFVPLAVMALALTLIVMSLCKAGFGYLNRSVFLLGTMFWLCAAKLLQAADPLRILLSGTPLPNIAAALLGYCPPLLCVAAGVALGTRKTDRTRSQLFAEVFWGYGIFLFPMTSALAAVPSMTEGDWVGAAPWLVAVPASVLVCRWRIKAIFGASTRQLASGELRDRVLELATRAGRKEVKVFVSSSKRSQASNAFALLRNGIALTAALVRALSRREVDAVVAHELSHFSQRRQNPWAALALAAVLFQTRLAEVYVPAASVMFTVLLIPIAVFFMALRGARKREFAADAGSAALTGDPRAMISGLARIARDNRQPLQVNAVVEWFSTHPSTHRRIRALAAIGRLEPTEVETLCSNGLPGEPYSLPPEDGSVIFTLAWQNANAARYTWTALLGASMAGLLAAWLLDKSIGAGALQFLAGIALGCAMTKMLAASVLSASFARLGRKLSRKLGVSGQLVGLAADNEPRVYSGFRFSDVGFLSFEGGRLSYRSERTAIGLNAADVVDLEMIPAAPSSWRRMQPMVRFRDPESGQVKAFILHPVEWGASPRRLLNSIKQWRAEATSTKGTLVDGLAEVAGKPFEAPTIAKVARGFKVPGSVTLVGVMVSGWWLRTDSWPAWYAIVITACAYTFMFLPAMFATLGYRSTRGQLRWRNRREGQAP